MTTTWKCPSCKRSFRQRNQRHACGVGDRKAFLEKKPPALVGLYRTLEKTLKSYGAVEIVTRERYALFRTTRIFADLTFTRDALRLVIHLNAARKHPLFVKVGRGENGRVSHVAMIHDAPGLSAVGTYLKEAYDLARSE